MKESTLETLVVTDNESTSFQVNGDTVAVMITTTESSVITLQTSVDGSTFSTNANFSETVNGTAEFNLNDFKDGQWAKFVATSGTMTECKVLR